MRYILTVLSVMSFSLQAVVPTKEEQVRSIVAKLMDYTESFEALMEDRLGRIVDIPLDYERLKIQDGPEAAINHYRELFNAPSLTEDGLLNYAHGELPRMTHNTTISIEFRQKIETSQRYKTPQGQASFLFQYLMNRHHAYIAQHLEEMAKGTIPTCDPAQFDTIESAFDRVTVKTSLSVYQETLYFLKKLYPLLDMAYLDDISRRMLILDKHLRDILEGRNQEPDHPEAGYETFPHQHFIPKLFPSEIPQATATSSAKELKRIQGLLANRQKILIYFKASPRIINGQFATNAEGHIDFDALSKIPAQDQLSKVIAQTRTLIGPGSDSFFREEYAAWQTKNAQPKPTPQATSQPRKPQKKKKKVLTAQPTTQPMEEIPASAASSSALRPLPTIDPKPVHVDQHTIRVDEHEKNREARRAAWLAKQAAEGSQGSPAATATPQYAYSEATRNTLRILFKVTTSENLKWDDFVSAWKELRSVIDGVENAELIAKSGSARKFEGGPIQEGRKQKPRSFVIHEPHKSDGHTLGFKAQDRIAKLFEEKFGWTQHKMKLD